MDEIELMFKNKELMTLNVKYNLDKMELYSEDGTYDCRNVPKLIEKFDNLDKLNYLELFDFVRHVSNCMKYYVCEKCRQFSKEIIKTINRFIFSFEALLS